MASHVYRYEMSGAFESYLRGLVGGSPVVIGGISPGTFLDITADDTQLDDLTAAMNQIGYVYVATDPTTKPATVSLGDMGPARAWPIVMAGTGQSAIQGQTGGTMGSTANYANNAAPASATLSNTAAGYTTLGGQFQFVAVAGAETDYALFGFQVPAGSAAVAGKNLYITGIRISTFNTVVAVATTATVLQWSLGIGSMAVSLATAEGSGTKARRVLPLGVQSFPVAAAVGAVATDLVQTFQTPQMVEAGGFVHVILKMPIATATATEIFRGTVAIEGFFE